MIVEVTLFDPATVLRTTVRDDREGSGDEQIDGVEYMWTEGNYACDCNRRLFIARARGEEEPEDETCGSTIVLERVVIDGMAVFERRAKADA